MKIYYIEAYDYESMYTVAMFTNLKKAQEFYKLADRFFKMVSTIRDLDRKHRHGYYEAHRTEPYNNEAMTKAIREWEDSPQGQTIRCFEECLAMFRDIYGLEDWYTSCSLRSMETSD